MGKTLHREVVSSPGLGALTAKRQRTAQPAINHQNRQLNDATLAAKILGWLTTHAEVIATALRGNDDPWLANANRNCFNGEVGDAYGEGRLDELIATLKHRSGKSLKVSYTWDPKRHRRRGIATFYVTVTS